MRNRLMAQTEAQKRAQKKYNEKNRASRNLGIAFQNAKAFIRKTDDVKKLKLLKSLIEYRIKEIE